MTTENEKIVADTVGALFHGDSGGELEVWQDRALASLLSLGMDARAAVVAWVQARTEQELACAIMGEATDRGKDGSYTMRDDDLVVVIPAIVQEWLEQVFEGDV